MGKGSWSLRKKTLRVGLFTLMETDLVWTQMQISNRMATLYHVEHVHIAQTRVRIPIPYFSIGTQVQVRTRVHLRQCK